MLGRIYKRRDWLVNIWARAINSRDQRHCLIFVGDGADWVIKDIAENIVKGINRRYHDKLFGKTDNRIVGYKNKIIHLGTLPILNKIEQIEKSNRLVQTVFHIDKAYEPLIAKLKNNLSRVNYIHTACADTRNKLRQAGIAEEKIKVIPLGVDLKIFHSVAIEEKKIIRQKLGLPADKIVVGSFQKDGNGWGEGGEPKLIKGPDIFCEAVIQLAKKYPIHVLLTGPARGYVKEKLEIAKVPYTHNYLKNYNDIVPYWQSLDLYLISSRIEGGPKALLEAWATGVPLVSTRVGMVADIAEDEKNVLLAEVEDANGLVKQAERIINDQQLAEQLIGWGLREVIKYDWTEIAKRYYNELYLPLLNRGEIK